MFSSGDLIELTGVDMMTLNSWCKAGILGPVEQCSGHRLFTFEQGFALAAAMLYRAEGCAIDRSRGVAHFLARLPYKQLKNEFRDGRTFPCPSVLLGKDAVPGVPGLMVPEPQVSDPGAADLVRRLSLVRLMSVFQAKAAKLKARPIRAGRGRRRITAR